MKHTNLFLILSFTASLCVSEQIEPKTLSFIYKNKEYFIENFGLQDSFSQQSFNDWEKNSADLISSMVYSFIKVHNKMSDSLYLKLLISVIDFPDPRPPEKVVFRKSYRHNLDTLNWVRDALNYLIHKSAFPVLRKYDDCIKAKLSRCEAPEELKVQLMALLNLSENEKEHLLTRINKLRYPPKEDSLKKELEKEEKLLNKLDELCDRKGIKNSEDSSFINHYKIKEQIGYELYKIKIRKGKTGKETFLWIRARAGEKHAEEELLSMFNRGDFDDKEKITEPLCMIGSDTCIKTLLLVFDKKILKKERNNHVCTSLRLNIIMNLLRLFPYDEPFSDRNIESLRPYLIGTSYENTKEEEEYADIFERWAYDKYGIKINYSYDESGPFKLGACTVDDAVKLLEIELERAKKHGDFYYEREKNKYGDLLKKLKEEQRKK